MLELSDKYNYYKNTQINNLEILAINVETQVLDVAQTLRWSLLWLCYIIQDSILLARLLSVSIAGFEEVSFQM